MKKINTIIKKVILEYEGEHFNRYKAAEQKNRADLEKEHNKILQIDDANLINSLERIPVANEILKPGDSWKRYIDITNMAMQRNISKYKMWKFKKVFGVSRPTLSNYLFFISEPKTMGPDYIGTKNLVKENPILVNYNDPNKVRKLAYNNKLDISGFNEYLKKIDKLKKIDNSKHTDWKTKHPTPPWHLTTKKEICDKYWDKTKYQREYSYDKITKKTFCAVKYVDGYKDKQEIKVDQKSVKTNKVSLETLSNQQMCQSGNDKAWFYTKTSENKWYGSKDKKNWFDLTPFPKTTDTLEKETKCTTVKKNLTNPPKSKVVVDIPKTDGTITNNVVAPNVGTNIDKKQSGTMTPYGGSGIGAIERADKEIYTNQTP